MKAGKSFKNKEKEESRLLKAFDRCKTRKCSKYIKKRTSEQPHFEKEQKIKCPQKSTKAFYDCSSKFYEGSTLQKLSEGIVKCSDKKCRTQKMKLKKLRNTMYI
jgi:hypothetical protein